MLQRSSRLAMLAIFVLAVTSCGCPSNSTSTDGGDAAGSNDAVEPVSDGIAETDDGQNSPADSRVASQSDAAGLVAKMQAAYANAQAYSDNAVLNGQYVEGDAWQPFRAEFSTKFIRPNKLSLRVRDLHVVSDGKMLRAVIKEEATDNFDGQMLERRAPAELHLADLYRDVEISSILGDAIVDGTPWPLRLLTSDPALRAFLMGDIGGMSDQKIGGQVYHRVRVRHQERAATLWIHPETFLLRRVELPAPDDGFGVRACVAEYVDAATNENAAHKPQDFRVDQPPGVKIVNFFVAPPIAVDLPSPLFGKEVGDFEFATTDGREVSRDDLSGTPYVLAWYLSDAASQQTLQQLQAVAKGLGEEKKVNFFAISPAPDAVTNDRIIAPLREWNVSIPVLRDTTAIGRDVFDVPGAPTVVILDGKHRVQGFKAGSDPTMQQHLPELLGRLIAGENPAGELRQMVADEAVRYRQQLAAAQSEASSTVLDLTETPLAEAHPPKNITLKEMWSSDATNRPGNILVVAGENGRPRILVHDQQQNWRTILELDTEGNVAAKHELPVPDDAAIALLRTLVDKDGQRWYAGSARLANHVYVFNDKFELVFRYPDSDARHNGVGDFALVNFQDTADPQLCVGFWGLLGTHGVDMSGNRKWSNRVATPVIALAQSPANEAGWRQVLATTDRGEVLPINGFGRNDPIQQVEGYAITQLLPSPMLGDKATAYMGMGVQPNGAPLAVALSSDLKVLWDVPLPAGVHRNQIYPVATGQLFPGGSGEWVFANADGSIGIVSDDLSAYDSFATGQRLSGIAVAVWGGNHVLLFSTPKGVQAWKVQQLIGPVPSR